MGRECSSSTNQIRHLGTSAFCNYMLGVPEQTLRGIPLGFGVVMEDKTLCTFMYILCIHHPVFGVVRKERGLVLITCACRIIILKAW